MKFFLLLTLFLFLSSCSIVKTPTTGLIFTKVKTPKEFKKLPIGDKKVEVCAYSIGGLVAFGDASIEKAVEKGKLTDVTSIAEESRSVLNLVAQYCIIVTGS